MTGIGNRGKQVPPPVTRLGRPDARLADPERSLTAKLTSIWQVLVNAMGEERAYEFRDYLRAHSLDILPIEYGMRVTVSNLRLTPAGTPQADVWVVVDRVGSLSIDGVRIRKDRVSGLWGLLTSTDKWETPDRKLLSEARFRVSGQYARNITLAIIRACVDAEMLPESEIGRVRKGQPPARRENISLEHATGMSPVTGRRAAAE